MLKAYGIGSFECASASGMVATAFAEAPPPSTRYL
jgi:hypothetical protein